MARHTRSVPSEQRRGRGRAAARRHHRAALRLVTTDTRPLRGHPLAAYAGCMAVLPAASIDRVYTSRPYLSTGSIAPPANFVFDGHLGHLNHRKQAMALETPCIKVAKVAKTTGRFTRGSAIKAARISGALAPLTGLPVYSRHQPLYHAHTTRIVTKGGCHARSRREPSALQHRTRHAYG